jgi:hypothetical protein
MKFKLWGIRRRRSRSIPPPNPSSHIFKNASGPRYRDANVDVKLVKFRSNQNTATLAVQEDRVNHFDAASVAAGAPQATESITEHTFNFAESNGAWELVSASNNDPTSVENAR